MRLLLRGTARLRLTGIPLVISVKLNAAAGESNFALLSGCSSGARQSQWDEGSGSNDAWVVLEVFAPLVSVPTIPALEPTELAS